MKQTGSKFGVLIIVIAMVILASVLFDATNTPLNISDDELSEPIIYEDEMKLKELASTSLVFEEFVRSEERFYGEISAIDYSTNPLAKTFENIIQPTYQVVGANYANQYSVISWSCGIDCQSSVIIDVTNGRIADFGIISAYGLSYSPTSKLLVINPKDRVEEPTTRSDTTATDYYLINEEGILSLIAKEINGENLINACLKATTTARNILTNEEEVFESVCKVPFGWEIISL